MSADHPLTAVLAALRSIFGTTERLPGVARGLLVENPEGWAPAARLADSLFPVLMDRAERRWQAQPHVAASLAWKSYTYWLALPAMLGFATARRVPLLTGDAVLVRFDDPRPLLTMGVRADVPVAVLPGDPFAGRPGVEVMANEDELLDALRRSLLDHHLIPLLTTMRDRVRIGRRVLLGSLASGMAYGLSRTAEPPAPVLAAMGLDGLVDVETAQRRTCCLAFTLPRPKVCTDCCLKNHTCG